MPQMLLPLFSEDMILISPLIGYAKRDGQVYYFNGQMPLFMHDEKDEQSFKMFMAQLYVTGNATQAEINRTFGMNKINMKRWTKIYREKGPGGFFEKNKRKTQPRVLTSEVISTVQSMLDDGDESTEIANKLGIKANTINKAIQNGRLHRANISKKKTIHSVSKVKEASKTTHHH